MALDFQLQSGPCGEVQLVRGEDTTSVRVAQCFPWAASGRFLSLRSDDGEELGFVKELADLDDTSRNILEVELMRLGHTFHIVRVIDIKKEIELQCWDVETVNGRRQFQTALDDWPYELPGGVHLLRDVYGDLYTIRDVDKMDPRSRDLLWALIG